MRIDFAETFALPPDEVFSYFETPADWARLYGLAAEVRDLGDGWFAVPLARFPFPLVAKNTAVEPGRLVRWEFRGFWRGGGEVRFEPGAGSPEEAPARVTSAGGESSDPGPAPRISLIGYEEVSVRWLGPFSKILETLYLERRFRAIWALGWRRLRKRERTSTVAAPASNAAGQVADRSLASRQEPLAGA